MHQTIRSLPFIAALGALAASTAHAVVIEELEFDSLPTAQGWTLNKSGPHADDAETTIFTATGTSLTQTTVGLGMGSSTPGEATYQYTIPAEFDGADVISLFFTTAVTGHEQTRQDFSYAGHRFTIIFGGQTAYVGVKPSELYANGVYFTPPGFDGTIANSYQLTLDTTTSQFSFFLNGNEVRTGGNFSSGLTSGFYIMDGTGTANANAELSQLIGVSGTVIPEPSAFALIFGVAAIGLVASRRRRA